MVHNEAVRWERDLIKNSSCAVLVRVNPSIPEAQAQAPWKQNRNRLPIYGSVGEGGSVHSQLVRIKQTLHTIPVLEFKILHVDFLVP